ncbi:MULTISPECIES: GvpL/GvpF family gas vesicle protein [unclassified Streptomyces]|uniref:GvpL/GvpF family gas vesicle protein n=1 Tax=unclassified Streptomyces TaxID=2593676 RepID=UPI001F04C90D|nr:MULTISPECIES: GvpL/GvpF family gas vesicle protein [unclassified Streptomyces]MCH0563428.1 GvpL/GvpF family gas vesicle protein [Streptomyces sp. MUM 2J]MCH0571464.1 GvpL/GvpF family gas vesicle protein [Streptomyces sp. MUM 136J]
MTGLRYVYAICRPFGAPLQAQLTGVAGAPPRRLVHRGLVAVFSEVPESDFAEAQLRARLEDPDWLTATARAHQGVVDALTVVTTPLPLRPGTVFRDDSGVRTMIEEREHVLNRTLDRLEGRVEWRVRVYADTGAEQDAGPGENARRKAEQFAGRLHAELSGYAEDSRTDPLWSGVPSGEPEASGHRVLHASYLVPRTRCEEFVEAVDRTKGEDPETRVELTGPWAAYSFVEDEYE